MEGGGGLHRLGQGTAFNFNDIAQNVLLSDKNQIQGYLGSQSIHTTRNNDDAR